MCASRNEIAHEYSLDELRELFKSILEQTPVLFPMIDRDKVYCLMYTEKGITDGVEGESV